MSGEFIKGAVVATAVIVSTATGAAANGYQRCMAGGGTHFTPGMDYTPGPGDAVVVINGVRTKRACVQGDNIEAINRDKARWLQQQGVQYRGNKQNAVPYQR